MSHSEKTYIVEYNSNNSGGDWWLSNADWQALEAEGWTVQWGGLDFCNSKHRMSFEPATAPNTCPENECQGHRRFESLEEALAADYSSLGCQAKSATIEVKAYSYSLAEGVAALWWQEALPGQDVHAEGCNCCGRPHNFYAEEVK